MKIEQESKNIGFIGFFSLVPFFSMMMLKLFGVIDWSWWFVTMPIWLPSTLVFIAVIGTILLVLWDDKFGGD